MSNLDRYECPTPEPGGGTESEFAADTG